MIRSIPLIVGIGGTTVPSSSTETALKMALGFAEQRGARTAIFGSADLVSLGHYGHGRLDEAGVRLVSAVREADGLIIASPGYHGMVSGLLKNALDHIEELASDNRPYLTDLPVGIIATAYGWQAAVTTLSGLRSVVHALRGWPAPLGVAINTVASKASGGVSGDPEVAAKLAALSAQVCKFAMLSSAPEPETGLTGKAHGDARSLVALG